MNIQCQIWFKQRKIAYTYVELIVLFNHQHRQYVSGIQDVEMEDQRSRIKKTKLQNNFRNTSHIQLQWKLNINLNKAYL